MNELRFPNLTTMDQFLKEYNCIFWDDPFDEVTFYYDDKYNDWFLELTEDQVKDMRSVDDGSFFKDWD